MTQGYYSNLVNESKTGTTSNLKARGRAWLLTGESCGEATLRAAAPFSQG